MIINSATEKDREAIIVLLQTYFLETNHIELPNFFTAVNEETQRIVGCAELVQKPLCELRLIAVHPSYRNRGIGTKLVTRALERAGSDVCLRTTVPAFFQKMGFEKLEKSSRKDLWEDCKACDIFAGCTQTAMVYYKR